ncbi:Ulp1 protease family, C-terminal catalytic domain containing protein [Parasponia andersonii]|uniref:Ulp1 protease family, C-terminal catalytic domain containing protein n=1 Tax=Parasponia andersonii TaxID=3476 RepID=A0A2P5CMT8_PARAD|nr:Ulp1 protease family, C-terminal catalytic domain containing protein [Parasponia andersonii]
MGGSNPDEKILSYNDVVLRRSDLDILSGPYFLNDRIIEFYLSYLSSCHASQDVLLVPPSISYWIMNCPLIDSLKEFVEPLHLPAKTLVLFPINDNDDVSKAEGGSHWSLLAYERNDNVFIHHDSSKGINRSDATRLYNRVRRFMSDSGSTSNIRYLECTDSPQQKNGYDCGLYVTAIARVICLWHGDDRNKAKDGSHLWFSSVKEQVTPSSVAEMRNEILGLIRGLMEKKQGLPAG